MTEPFLGEIRMFAGDHAPAGWALCNGQILLIQENPALYSVLGITYGGDGGTTFALPDLRGRMPVHIGPGFLRGQRAGSQTVTLTAAQIGHSHAAAITLNAASGPGNSNSPAGQVWAAGQEERPYSDLDPDVTLASDSIQVTLGSTGQSSPQAHTNMPPFIVISYIIALEGELPPR